jgi:ubiquinone biosynthesis protein
VTFEAPAETEPLGARGYREVLGALVRLAVVEGIFFADLAPERFVRSDGEIWLTDPTEASALDPERLRGLAEVLAAVRRGDVDGVVRALPLTGCTVPRDARVLQRELRDVLGSLGGPLWSEHSLAEIRARGLEAARRGNAVLPAEIAHSFDSLVKTERLGVRSLRRAERDRGYGRGCRGARLAVPGPALRGGAHREEARAGRYVRRVSAPDPQPPQRA